MKAVVAAFNQEKALVGAFSVITNLRMELFETLLPGRHLQEGDPPAAGQHRDRGHPGRGAVSVAVFAVSAVSAVHSAVSTNLSRCRVQNPENRMVATTRSLDTGHIE